MLTASLVLVLATVVLPFFPALAAGCGADGFKHNLATGFPSSYKSSAGPTTADGLYDAHWDVRAPGSSRAHPAQICQQGDTNFFYPPSGGNSWVANGPNSDWIAVSCTSQDPGMDATYPFILEFHVPDHVDLSTLAIENGYVASDNYCVLELNGVQLADLTSSTNYDQLNSFPSPSASAFKRGYNKLVLTNTDTGAWNGARLEGFVTGSCTQ